LNILIRRMHRVQAREPRVRRRSATMTMVLDQRPRQQQSAPSPSRSDIVVGACDRLV
jgi:hypothetical protein